MAGPKWPIALPSGGAKVILRLIIENPGNNRRTSARPIPRTFGLEGLLKAKSYHNNFPPGTSTRLISRAMLCLTSLSNTDVKSMN